jgi:hypothetical protein
MYSERGDKHTWCRSPNLELRRLPPKEKPGFEPVYREVTMYNTASYVSREVNDKAFFGAGVLPLHHKGGIRTRDLQRGLEGIFIYTTLVYLFLK